MKIAFFSCHDFDKEYFNLYNIYNYQYTYLDDEVNKTTILLAKNHDVICVFANDKIDVNVIKIIAALNIKLIALRATGFNNIDLKAAKKYKITIVRVPEYSPHAVAEHAVALLLTLNRKIHKAYNHIKEGNFSLTNLLGFDLYQKNVGVIGAGRIGSVFIKIMLGFGCNVFVYDPVINPEIVKSKAKVVDLETLYKESDIISLHCPLNKDTKHIINAQSINLMKKGVFIINTGRGGLIDSLAAKDGLINGRIGYLALDVYEKEGGVFFHNLSNSLIDDEILLEFIMYPNVLITSHQAFFTKEALTAIAKITTENINNFFQGKIDNKISFE
ncbi:MAG TPA: 2-hydroxyacid dehydrogenase [Burkholderiales bacterium]|nr:2-hydroxyacid dehydrogenase [Burkholderiales bacterium]